MIWSENRIIIKFKPKIIIDFWFVFRLNEFVITKQSLYFLNYCSGSVIFISLNVSCVPLIPQFKLVCHDCLRCVVLIICKFCWNFQINSSFLFKENPQRSTEESKNSLDIKSQLKFSIRKNSKTDGNPTCLISRIKH
jgi:hypothetical protein